MSATTCSACGARVEWRLHERTEKPAPINVSPPGGSRPNVELLDGNRYRLVPSGEGTTTSHFADCPQAAQFRGERR